MNASDGAEIRGVIAAAGAASRMFPSSKVCPKELFPIGKIPAIAHVATEMVDAGITEIMVIVRKGDHLVEALFDPASPPPANVRDDEAVRRFELMIRAAKFSFVEQDGPYGNGTPLLTAVRAGMRAPCVYAFADDVVLGENASAGLIATFCRSGRPVLAAQPVRAEDMSKFGILECERSGGTECVVRFVEKPRPGETLSNLASLGRYLLNDEVIAALKTTPIGRSGELWLSDAFLRLLQVGSAIAAFPLTQGHWFTVGDPDGFANAVNAWTRSAPVSGGRGATFAKRPWGFWEECVAGPDYRVKRLVVDPGMKLSLQCHRRLEFHLKPAV